MAKRCVLWLFLIFVAPACPVWAAPPLKLAGTIQMPQVKCYQPNLSQKQLAQAVDTERIPGISCHFDHFAGLEVDDANSSPVRDIDEKPVTLRIQSHLFEPVAIDFDVADVPARIRIHNTQ